MLLVELPEEIMMYSESDAGNPGWLLDWVE